MVKSVLGVNHQGLRDWVVQRLSAIYMAVYFIVLSAYILLHSGMDFAEWHALFACTAMKIATMLFLVGLLLHAWVGIWTIFTDYVKCAVVRAILNSLVWLMLGACFFWGLMILWSV